MHVVLSHSQYLGKFASDYLHQQLRTQFNLTDSVPHFESSEHVAEAAVVDLFILRAEPHQQLDVDEFERGQ